MLVVGLTLTQTNWAQAASGMRPSLIAIQVENLDSSIKWYEDYLEFRVLDKKEFKDLEIFYSTPFNPVRTDPTSEQINLYFKDKLYARPSDMVFRGFETMYRFGKLLRELGPNISSGIGEKKYKVFTDFDIQPVLLDKQKQQLDYFENKKLYIIKKVNGVVSTVF